MKKEKNSGIHFLDRNRKNKYFLFTLLFIICFCSGYKVFFDEKISFICNADARVQHIQALSYIGQYGRQIIRNFLSGDFSIMIMGIEKIIRGKKPYTFIFSIWYAAITGFYFLYMSSLCMGIYAMVSYLCKKEKNWNDFFKTLFSSVSAYILGLFLSAPFLLPSILSFFHSARTESTGKIDSIFYPLTTLKYYTVNLITSPVTMECLGMVSISLLLVVLLFVRRQNKKLRILLALSIFAFSMPLFSLAANGFAYPSRRWIFALTLLVGLAAVEMLPFLVTLAKWEKWMLILWVLIYGILAGIFKNGGITAERGSFFFLTISVVLILLVQKKEFQKYFPYFCMALLCGNIIFNCKFAFSMEGGRDMAKTCISYDQFQEDISQNQALAAKEIIGGEDARIATDIAGKNVNSAIYSDYRGVTGYWSLLNRNYQKFFLEMENSANIPAGYMQGCDNRTALTTMLSTKYFATEREDMLPYNYELIKNDQQTIVAKNKDYLPIGYTYNQVIEEETFGKYNGLEKQAAMLQSVALDEVPNGYTVKQPKFELVKNESKIKEMSGISWKGNQLKGEKKSSIVYELDSTPNSEVYVRIRGSRELEMNYATVLVKFEDQMKKGWIEGVNYKYYSGREDYCINLGYHETPIHKVVLEFPEGCNLLVEDIGIYSQPMEHYSEQVEKLKEESLQNIQISDNQLKGDIQLKENKILCITIPYSLGWKATIDGKTTKITRANHIFMAIPMEKGSHKVILHYRTPGLTIGFLCFVFGTIVMAGMIIYEKMNSNTAKRK